MKRTGAQILARLLQRQGIDTVAGIPGGASLPLYDALRSSDIRHVLARHEQGAGFIAQGMARVTGRAAVCLATSGPGATNLLTAVADAKADSVPLVAITGQVPTTLLGSDAFQEVDTYGLTLPITKHNFLVRNPAELLDVIPRAFEIAESGRPGPVVIDLPKDVQTATALFERWPDPRGRRPPSAFDRTEVARLAEMIHAARRPVIYVGGGVIASGASEQLLALARKNAIPVTCTLTGLGAFPATDPLFLGMLGMHGAPYTNLALERADLLLALGVRFDDRATGKVAEFCPRARIAHVDIDRSEIDKLKPSHLSIAGDARQVLRALIPSVRPDRRQNWNRRVASLRNQRPLRRPESSDRTGPFDLIETLAEVLDPETVITTDVGQHQMWVAQAYPFRRPRTLLTSGGLGTMGFGLPAAIGAALALERRPRSTSARRLHLVGTRARRQPRVICISGDGSLLMNIQELATLAELGLDITVLVMNNGQLGLVRQQQELFFGARYFASCFDRRVDFVAVAGGFGVQGIQHRRGANLRATIERALSRPGPSLIDVPIREAANVLPIVPPGAANRQMIEGGKRNARYRYQPKRLAAGPGAVLDGERIR